MRVRCWRRLKGCTRLELPPGFPSSFLTAAPGPPHAGVLSSGCDAQQSLEPGGLPFTRWVRCCGPAALALRMQVAARTLRSARPNPARRHLSVLSSGGSCIRCNDITFAPSNPPGSKYLRCTRYSDDGEYKITVDLSGLKANLAALGEDGLGVLK